MSEDQGYFIVPRAVADMAIYKMKPYSPAHAYIDLWRIANYKPGQIITLRNIHVDVERGQVGWSFKRLADEWGWSTSKVSRFLLKLSSGGQISMQTSNITTLIIIKDYCKWDIDDTQNDTQTTRRRHADDTQTSTINTDKAVISKNSKEAALPDINSLPPLKALKDVPGYNLDMVKDGDFLQDLIEEFPEVDVMSLLKGWKAYKLDVPFKKNDNQRAQLRNQFETAKKHGLHRKVSGNGNGGSQKPMSDAEKIHAGMFKYPT